MLCRRSIGHTSILLLGGTGVGKSSTINNLLGVDIAKVTDTTSTTTSTKEYMLTASYPELEAEDLSLSIIDSPGFDDTRGKGQDACNLMSIATFCENHPSLKNSGVFPTLKNSGVFPTLKNSGVFPTLKNSRVYPNVIMICIQATDVRFQGDNSAFVRSLKAIKRLNIVDKKNCNVVVVVTWAAALPRNKEKWVANTQDKAGKLKSVILQTLQVDAPVIFLENEHEDAEWPTQGDCVVLPDETLQPENLLEAIVDLMRAGNDSFGKHCITHFFAQNGNADVMQNVGLDIEAKDAKSEQLNGKEMEFLRELEGNSSTGTLMPPVAQRITDYLSSNTLDEVRNRCYCILYILH